MTAEHAHSPADGEEHFYRGLCEQAAVALIATDADLNVVFWNAAAEEVLDDRADERLGKPLELAVPAHRRGLLNKLVRRTIDRGQVCQFEIGGEDAAGRDVLVVLCPIPASAPGGGGLAAWVIDQTLHKRTAERLTRARQMASLGTLARGVAHHFNNILGGMATFVDYALTSGDGVSMKRALQRAAEAIARASQITQSLLSFARPDHGSDDLADLTETVLTFSHLVEQPLAEQGIRIELDLLPVPVMPVEANRMHEVLGHVLANAEDAMPDGGTIRMGLQRTPGQVRLTIADTGCGIPTAHLPLVFEPFFTTKGLLSGGQKANPGLGLSVVHGIVSEMGGQVDIESVEGEGTVVTICFLLPPAPKTPPG